VENALSEQRARLRINLTEGEFEVEGSEAFVSSYVPRFERWLSQLDEAAPAGGPRVKPSSKPRPGPVAESFGELLQHLPRSASDVDRMLLAGYFVHLRSADRSFATGEASALLTEQGVKVGNPSQCVRQSLAAKKVFKHQGRYRISQTGTDFLRQLVGDALPG
jgi:hypothetical protein